MQAGQALAKPGEAGEGRIHRGPLEPTLLVHAGTEAQRLAPGVLAIDLVALDAADLETGSAVRSEIDDGEQRVGFLSGIKGARSAATAERRLAEIARHAAPNVPTEPRCNMSVMPTTQTAMFVLAGRPRRILAGAVSATQ
jgi:hypothetical protein